MSKLVTLFTGRLVCLRGARALTNAIGQVGKSEDFLDYEYEG